MPEWLEWLLRSAINELNGSGIVPFMSGMAKIDSHLIPFNHSGYSLLPTPILTLTLIRQLLRHPAHSLLIRILLDSSNLNHPSQE